MEAKKRPFSRRELVKKITLGTIGAGALWMCNLRTAAGAAQVVDCSIMMFHETPYDLVARTLERNLSANRFPITVSHLGQMLRGEIPVERPKYCCLTFDDRLKSQYDGAFKALNDIQAQATFFTMAPGWPGDGEHQYMTDDQIVEIAKTNREIGSHCIDHPNLLALREKSVSENNYYRYFAQLVESRSRLMELTGQPVTSFAAPYGAYDQKLIQELKQVGYKEAVIVAPDMDNVPVHHTLERIYELPRLRIS
jgi:peptidoglycan/xylan/chitin deacetylase (PgdA/CDA1 family)